jgi:hypothetical protein
LRSIDNPKKAFSHRFAQINADTAWSYARSAVHPIGAAKNSFKPLFIRVNPRSSAAQLLFSGLSVFIPRGHKFRLSRQAAQLSFIRGPTVFFKIIRLKRLVNRSAKNHGRHSKLNGMGNKFPRSLTGFRLNKFETMVFLC